MLVEKIYEEDMFPLLLGLLISSDNLISKSDYEKHIKLLEDMDNQLSESKTIPTEDKEKYSIKIKDCLQILNNEIKLFD